MTASTAFIPTIGQTSIARLKPIRITQPIRFSPRRRRIRVCSNDTTTSAEPPHPMMLTRSTSRD
jgi:hypothetical protein